MARGLLSNQGAALAAAAAAAAAVLASASSVPPPQSCDAEGGSCALAVEEEGDHASLLVRATVAKAHDHAAAAAVAAASTEANRTIKETCNEVKYQGLCYRTCTDMGAMEPRGSASKCGGKNDYNFIQRCNEDGTSTIGSGSAPGIGGRPMGGCFGTDNSQPSPDAPNMCTTSCSKKAPTTTLEGCPKKLCCKDGVSTPSAYNVDGNLVCSCSLGEKPKLPWMPAPEAVLTTPLKSMCDTVCQNAKAWKMFDGLKYCCRHNKEPTITKKGGPDYSVECTCAGPSK